MNKYHLGLFSKKSLITIAILANISNYSFAATATTTFLVTANVIAACAVTATPMAFGTYSPVSGTNLDQTSTITTTCTNTTQYTVGLNAGSSSSPTPTVTTRKMTGVTPANTLAYGLYQNAGRTTNWGNTPGTDTPAAVIGTGAAQAQTVYGRINAGTAAAIDTYSDTITVTVNF